jgi:alpha-beta hydrolase superfamily lysophospholipase
VPKGSGPFPALVLVHGSGPNDRDESVSGTKVFKDLALGLASRGVAVLRYDKRTKIYPLRFAREANFTMTDETVVDAVRAAALLRTEAAVDPRRVFVLGHSQGGYMAPRIGKRDPKLAGLIVCAGNVRPLEDLILEQNEYLAGLQGQLTPQQRAKLEEVRRQVQEVRNFKAGQKVPALLPVPAAYLLDLQGYNPAAEAQGLSMPLLILQGERDYQVTMRDFALWKAALGGRNNVTLRSYAKLNHLFIAGEGKSTPAEYASGHVDRPVVDDIAQWILAGGRK